MLGLCIALHTHASDTQTFDIPKQRADLALIAFAEQADRTLLFSFDETSDKTANRLSGQYEVVEALEVLLAGTGLSISMGTQGQLSVVEEVESNGETVVNVKKPKSMLARIGAALAGLVIGSSAHAQAGDENAQNASVVEEIVVTATKRETTVMEVPASVTAFTAEQLEEREIESFLDLNVNVPNINSGLHYGQVFMTIRGVGFSQGQGTADPAVAQHVDGIYLPRTASLRGAYFDLESIEVLRGPQGTLYGRNSTGGSVNLVTNKPTEEFEGRIGVLYGDYDRVQVTGLVSGPIAENVLGRVSVIYDDRDHYTENLLPGFDDVDHEEIKSIRGALRFSPSDTLTIDLNAHYEEREGSMLFDSYTEPSDLLFPNLFTNALYSLEPHKTYSDVNTSDNREGLIASLSVDWAFSENVTLIAKSGYVTSEFFADTDNDGIAGFAVTAVTGHDSDTFSQELNLHASLMDNKLDLLAGLYFYRDDLEWFTDLPLNFLDDLLGLPPLTSFVSSRFEQETEAYGIFVDATYNVSDDWQIYGGVRFSEEEKEALMEALQVVPVCGFGLPASQLKNDWDDVSYRVGVQHDLSEQANIYAQYSKGFRSGGFDTSSCNDEYDQENVGAFEVGYKATFADGRVALRSSAFYYDYQDLQLSQIVGLQLNVDNAAKSIVWGIELETQFRVSDQFQVAVNYAHLDATYDDYEDCDGLLFPGNCLAFAVGGGFAVFEDVSGNPLNRAPENSVGVTADYIVPLGNGGEFGVTAQWTWTDDIQYRPFNNEDDQQDAFSIANLFLTYTPSGDSNLRLRGFVKNLTDEEYITALTATTSVSVNLLTMPWAPPRTWGLEAIWEL